MNVLSKLVPRAHPVEWVYLVLGLFLVWRYFFFYDDSFVYFRYVDNLVYLKMGLVYNEGELVEGYSSPLWTLLLAALRLSGASWVVLARATSTVGFFAFWWMLVALNRRLSPKDGGVCNLPLAYLGSSYGVLCYFSAGMETVLLHLAAASYALFFLRPGSRVLQLAVAVSPLVRHELAVPLAVAVAWAWWRERGFPVALVGAAAALNLAWELFRIVYYADLLPNTYYLKNENDFAQGLVYLHDTFGTYHFYAFTVVVVVGLVLLRGRRVEGLELGARGAMVLAALPVVLFVAKIGGAPIHYRYLAFPYVLLVCAGSGVVERFLATFAPRRAPLAAPLLGLAVAAGTATLYPRQLDRHPLLGVPEHEEVDEIYDAAYHRKRIGVDGSTWEGVVNAESLAAFRDSGGRYRHVLALTWCQRAYKDFDKRVVHAYGLCDAILARCDVPAVRPSHKPGLVPLANDLVRLYEGRVRIGPGMHRRAVERGVAAGWIARNLETIEEIERKVYNTHDLGENLRLALTHVPEIEP